MPRKRPMVLILSFKGVRENLSSNVVDLRDWTCFSVSGLVGFFVYNGDFVAAR
jgi:hypothetical protein